MNTNDIRSELRKMVIKQIGRDCQDNFEILETKPNGEYTLHVRFSIRKEDDLTVTVKLP